MKRRAEQLSGLSCRLVSECAFGGGRSVRASGVRGVWALGGSTRLAPPIPSQGAWAPKGREFPMPFLVGPGSIVENEASRPSETTAEPKEFRELEAAARPYLVAAVYSLGVYP